MKQDTELAVVQDTSLPAQMMTVIARASGDPNVDVQKMQALLDMQKDIMATQSKIEYDAAMARVQELLPVVRKDGVIDLGSKGSIKYAKLEDIQTVVNPILHAEGFSTKYEERIIEGGALKEVRCIISRGGHSDSACAFVPVSDPGPGRSSIAQSMGSANTYGKRRALVNMLNIQIEGDDDDGTGASTAPITEDQVRDILRRIEETGANQGKFLAYLSVGAIEDIRQGDYIRAVDALERKRK